MTRKNLLIAVLLLAGVPLLPASEPDPVLVPTPRAKVLAATAASRPFLAASRSQQPVDLATRGYAESELVVRGSTSTNQSWVTRILVRQPQDTRRFSGRAIVELLNASAQYESAPLWGFSWEYFLRRGDAWVGVTTSPAGVDTLKTFNAARYEALNLAAGQPGGCGTARQGAPADDVIAQVGALLRSSSKENPLLNLNPQRLIAAGYSESGDRITHFAATLHGDMRRGDDAPIFDGYLNVAGLAALSPACVAAGVPRDVPFVSVLSGMNIVVVPDGSGETRGDGWRVFEVAGAEGAHPTTAAVPVTGDLTTAARVPAEIVCREPVMDQILGYAINAVWQQFDDLLVLKQPMVNLPPIAGGINGETSGGWRLPQVELPLMGPVPRRSETATAAPKGCNTITGSMARFDAATLKQRYRDRNEYLRRFNTAVDEAVRNRLLVKEDAAALKAATARTTPTF
jgi:hypothetical protein